MLMMNVWKMLVFVFLRLVLVSVAVRFGGSFWQIFVAVVFIVRVSVFVFKRCVNVFVSVFFGQMQVNAEAHQNGGGDKCQTD